MNSMRNSRSFSEMRKIQIIPDYCPAAYGSVLIAMGNTRVICAVSPERDVPEHAKNRGTGWLSAEYSLLPYSTRPRTRRPLQKQDGRSVEIQRLVGRALRGAVDLSLMKDHSLVVDCDVLEADGGTRTASITGACIALKLAFRRMLDENLITANPLINHVAAISVGILENEILLDLDYREDSKAEVDMNVVMNDKKEYIEIQGTGEGSSFSHQKLQDMLDIASSGIEQLISIQKSY